MIKKGDKKNFIFVGGIGFIEAGENTDDAIERINHAEVQREIRLKRQFKELQKQFPNRNIIQCGSTFIIEPE